MDMGALIAMPTSAQILTLSQWFSPAYPVGSFAYSHGLEWAVQAGVVQDIASLRAWLSDVMEHGSGQSDALFLAAAYRSGDAASLNNVNATCRAFASSGERLKETDLQGAAFCKITCDVWDTAMPRLAYPVAVGRAAKLLDLPLEPVATLYLQSFMSNLVSAAIRLVPLGQTAGQGLIRTLTPLCSAMAQATNDGDMDNLTSSALLCDIAAMKHETQYSRVFRT